VVPLSTLKTPKQNELGFLASSLRKIEILELLAKNPNS
jgi:hypothetical protein